MSKKTAIPLLRSAIMEGIVEAAAEIGVPVKKIAQQSRLPLAALEDPTSMISQVSAQRFVMQVSRYAGDSAFGFKMGQPIHVSRISSVTPLLYGCESLYEILQKFCKFSSLQSTITRYELDEGRDLLWMSQKGPRVPIADDQVEIFQTNAMIQLVQFVAGETWRPPIIYLMQAKNPEVENTPLFNPSKIFYRRQYSSIAIPKRLLTLPVPKVFKTSNFDVQPASGDFKTNLMELLIPYLGEHTINLDLAAEITNLSSRTLQRYLKESSTSYDAVLEEIRFRQARKLLEQNELKLIEISEMLGYLNAPNFSRAFKRWAGITPKDYRKMLIR